MIVARLAVHTVRVAAIFDTLAGASSEVPWSLVEPPGNGAMLLIIFTCSAPIL